MEKKYKLTREKDVYPKEEFLKNLHPSVREIAGVISEESLAKAEKISVADWRKNTPDLSLQNSL